MTPAETQATLERLQTRRESMGDGFEREVLGGLVSYQCQDCGVGIYDSAHEVPVRRHSDHCPRLALMRDLDAALTALREREWRPITEQDKQLTDALWWVVPKTVEETYIDTSGRPIQTPRRLSGAASYLHRGAYGSWSALSKAVLTHPLPPPPTQETR